LENLELPSIKFSLISKKKGWWVNLFIRTKTTFIPAGMSRILWMPGYPRYRDYYQSRTIIVQNHKGGTGKSTTSVALAVAAALDLQLNARVLVIEWDPQGSIGSGMIQSVSEDDVFLTAIDAILGVYEEGSEYKKYLDMGYSEAEIIENMPFSTHLPNLDVITAFPTDARFKDKYWQCSKEERTQLLLRFKEVIMPVLKAKYDLIIFDTLQKTRQLSGPLMRPLTVFLSQFLRENTTMHPQLILC
jgi:hypothetical protein